MEQMTPRLTGRLEMTTGFWTVSEKSEQESKTASKHASSVMDLLGLK